MAKRKTTDNLEDQKEKLFQAVDQLKESLNLNDEEMQKIKDWGIALLLTGVSVFVVYRLIGTVLGYKKDVPVMSAEPSSDKKHLRKSSPVSSILKEQLALILVAFAKQRLVRFLESKNLMDEDRDI